MIVITILLTTLMLYPMFGALFWTVGGFIIVFSIAAALRNLSAWHQKTSL